MGIGLPIFTFVVSIVGVCTGAVLAVRHIVRKFWSADFDEQQSARRRRLRQIRIGLIAAGALVLLSGFFALPILFHRGASPAVARVVPILQILAFLTLIGVSALTERVFRSPNGEALSLWRLAGQVVAVEMGALLAGALVGFIVLVAPRALFAHYGKLHWWEPYFAFPVSMLALATGMVARAFVLPFAIGRVFDAHPLVESEAAQAIAVAHDKFHFTPPSVQEIPWDGKGRVAANRRGLFGRHLGWRGEKTFLTAELCRDLNADEMRALALREVAHHILKTAQRRLLRVVAIGESLLLAAWIYPKLQVPLAVALSLDTRLVRLWMPLLLGAGLIAVALRAFFRGAEEDERRADLYAVEVLGASLTALSHGLHKVFSGTIAAERALDRRLEALDENLREPKLVHLLTREEREEIALHHRRVGFAAAGGFALLLIGLAISPYGHRTTMQWRVWLAIRAHDTAKVAALLKDGASANRENLLGVSPVSAAAGAGDLDLLRTLITHGGAVQNEAWPKQPLHEAAAQGRIDVIVFLLEKGAQVNAPDFFGRTPLMTAAVNGKRETVTYLIEHGARLGARDQSGHTALQLAERRGDREIARILRKANAR